MRTVIETDIFTKQAKKIWTENEYEEMIYFMSLNYDKGDVIEGSEGARKIRIAAKGKGKSGGARVIYYNLDDEEVVLLVTAFSKGKKTNIKTKDIPNRS